MSERCLKFSSLRHLLLDLGFKESHINKPFIGFRHDGSDTVIMLPTFRSNSWVYAHHLAYVRIMLDAKGLMDAEDFDRLVATSSAQHSVSN
jgi:hypothetical protein